MLSPMALEDMADLEAQGIKLAPSEIITLNELGLRVERGATSGDLIACPRIGWAGDTPIFQPTIQSDTWVSTYVYRWFPDTSEAFAACVLYACAHSQIRGFFTRSEMQDKASVLHAVEEWHKCLPVTAEQLKHALVFALYGDDAGIDVYPAPSEREIKSKEQITSDDFRTMLVDSLIAAGIGLSKEELETLTETRAMQILEKYNRNQGFVSERTNFKAVAEYGRTLAAIKRKHLEEKANGN